jgi:hypothetical protein
MTSPWLRKTQIEMKNIEWSGGPGGGEGEEEEGGGGEGEGPPTRRWTGSRIRQGPTVLFPNVKTIHGSKFTI